MVRHFNPSIAERSLRILNTKAGAHLPDEVSGPVAVIPITQISRIARSGSSTSTSAVTPLTTPSDKDFYLCGAMLSLVKDATCDIGASRTSLNIIIEGVTYAILSIPTVTLTAQALTQVATFNPPIKIDRATAIQMSSVSFTAGTMSRTCSFWGYTEEVVRS